METPNLILSIVEGPKKGETLDRMPGNFIRIGRVARGNTFAIKDAGISQKHLNIAFHPEISRWAVTDIGTSNGTIVNGAVISPNAHFPLTDGDIIKIGEKTLMSVKIYTPSLAPEPRTRRGRRIATAVTSPIGEEVDKEKVAQPAKHGESDASQGKSYPESANINDAMKPMPEEGKRKRPTRASTKACSSRGQKEQEEVDIMENAEDPTKSYQKGRPKRKKGTVSAGASRNAKPLEPVVLEGDCWSATSAIESTTRALKAKDEEMEVGHGKVEGPTKNGRKGRGRVKSGVEPARILRKDVPLEPVAAGQKIGRVVKALSMDSSARVLIMKEEDGETSEKVDGLVIYGKEVRVRSKRGGGSARVSWKDQVMEPVGVVGRSGRVTRASDMAMNRSAWVSKEHEGEDDEMKEDKVVETKNRGKIEGLVIYGKGVKVRGKRGAGSARVSWKDQVMEPVVVVGRRGRVTRASNMAMNHSALVSKEHEGEDEEMKEEKVVETDKNRRKQRARGKRGGRSTSVSSKGEAELDLESGEMKRSIFKNNANGDGKKLAVSKEVRVRVEEVENDKDTMMSRESNKAEDLHFPNKKDLTDSWSSFSEIRGIPNTTSKYREDRMINCHATPFEARVERALNRGIAETSSSVET